VVTDRTGADSADVDARPGGDERLVVMLHGAFLNAEVWHGYAETLGAGFRVLAPDYGDSGWGDESGGGEPGIEDAAAYVATQIDGAGARALVVGHSLGGYVSLQLCATRPDLVDGLVLVDASTPPRGFATLLDLHLRALEFVPASISRSVLGAFVAQLDPEEWHRLDAAGISMRRGTRAVRSLRTLDYWGLVRSIRCPILIVNGSRDWLFRSSEWQTAGAARQASVASIPGAGHLGPLHRRADLCALIREFSGQLVPDDVT
jgi:pimeloyl-ACP methyl ester carboxylesterase